MKSLLEKLEETLIKTNMELFSSTKDNDIEYFLKEKAIEFEKRSKSRTYIVTNADTFSRENFEILAYFTLSLKILKLSENISKNKVKKIDGFTGERNELAVHLIGQLGKSDSYQEEISGREILEMAIDKLTESINCIGGRIVLLECRNEEKLIKFYSANGFNFLQDTLIDGEIYKQFEKSIK